MFSMPPATATTFSPLLMLCAAFTIALRPDPHTILIVDAVTFAESPALIAACLAGFNPQPIRGRFITTEQILILAKYLQLTLGQI